MAENRVNVFLSTDGGELADLEEVIDGTEEYADWAGIINGEPIKVRFRLSVEEES